jgi:hypothetical protein
VEDRPVDRQVWPTASIPYPVSTTALTMVTAMYGPDQPEYGELAW